MKRDPRAHIINEIAGEIHRALADVTLRLYPTLAEILAALAEVMRNEAGFMVRYERGEASDDKAEEDE